MVSLLRRYALLIAVAVLACAFILSFLAARHEVQTTDEGVHLSAGYSYLRTGDFRMNPEHPPLLKYLAALPLLSVHPELPTEHTSWEVKNQWDFAIEFLYHNTVSAERILLLGRTPMLLVTSLLGLLIFLWSRSLFGPLGGLFSVTLYAFDPGFLAHGHYVTTDIGLAFFFTLTVFLFWRVLVRPSLVGGLLFSLSLCGALLAKFSAVILVPILIVLYTLHVLFKHGTRVPPLAIFGRFRRRFLLVALLCVVLFATFTVLLYHGESAVALSDHRIFQFFERRDAILTADDPSVYATTERVLAVFADEGHAFGRWVTTFLRETPIPAFAYVQGLFQVIVHNYFGHESFILGNHSIHGGWWYYFPFAFLVKTPLGTLMLFVLALVLLRRFRLRQSSVSPRRDRTRRYRFLQLLASVPFVYYLILVPVVIYVGWSMTSNINLGVRHLFPMYPFLFILIGGLTTIRPIRFRVAFHTTLLSLAACTIIVSVVQFPHYLSHASLLFGGNANARYLLKDSNFDWGQDLLHVRTYLDRGAAEPAYLWYFGQASQEYFDLALPPVPTDRDLPLHDLSGTYFVSHSSYLSPGGELLWLPEDRRIGNIGGSIYVYEF